MRTERCAPWFLRGVCPEVMSDERTARVAFSGALDIYRVPEVEGALPPVWSAERVVLDFSAVTSVDSTVLTVLLRYRRRFEEAGHSALDIVVITNANVKRAFEISGLTRVITVITSPET